MGLPHPSLGPSQAMLEGPPWGEGGGGRGRGEGGRESEEEKKIENEKSSKSRRRREPASSKSRLFRSPVPDSAHPRQPRSSLFSELHRIHLERPSPQPLPCTWSVLFVRSISHFCSLVACRPLDRPPAPVRRRSCPPVTSVCRVEPQASWSMPRSPTLEPICPPMGRLVSSASTARRASCASLLPPPARLGARRRAPWSDLNRHPT
jgi:hypothetical protein